MFNIIKKTINWGGQELSIETGRYARQADASVMVQMGGTSILATIVAAKSATPGQSFFPLTVHYQEKTYAIGKIPGGYIKREGRPTEMETLTSRLIDRPIRPLFHAKFKNKVQIICSLLSYDKEMDPSALALIAASAATSLSGVPFQGPLAAARVGIINDELVLNPTNDLMENSKLDLIVAGTQEGVLMVESEAHQLSEEQMLKAVMFGHAGFKPVLEMIQELKDEAGKPDWDVSTLEDDSEEARRDEIFKLIQDDLKKAYGFKDKTKRRHALDAITAKVFEQYSVEELTPEFATQLASLIKSLKKEYVRDQLIKTQKRIDGREIDQVRPIDIAVAPLPRCHGSALFTRGETQALAVTTLGTSDDELMVDALAGEFREGFMLHYNFPPFSVGETGRMGTPGRREVGHGKLAWRALHPMLPSKEEFPYTLRIVSEILESNGSSSMATVCGGSLAMMDAGIPLKSHVAGIAMGLIKEGKDFVVLSDILGDEDDLGDMDFKVAGTKEGITALQMDLKITSISEEIMKSALAQALQGRLHIIGEMEKALPQSREHLSEHAPQMETLKIAVDKIRDVIGSGGKVIREICEKSGARINIEDDGKVTIAAVGQEGLQLALDMINEIVQDPEVGQIYSGKVSKLVDFGAFVDFMGTSGLLHVSEIAQERVEKVSDHFAVGDMIDVKVVGIDNRGKIRLSRKEIITQD
ncbi:MAG: polyribonucleotide nucleotidyltransferase [Alphaproteobacteria bacterium]|nr:MAG: polyribonucleotide nucleotidyltransferase [Alphaproteobacteria bacterium]